MRLQQLLDALNRHGPDEERAAIALGLLIERERVRRPSGDDGGLRALVGDEISAIRLTTDEITKTVDALLGKATGGDPQPAVVWALSKASEPRSLLTLRRLLDLFCSAIDQRGQAIALSALNGVIALETSGALGAIVSDVARRSTGDVKEAADSWLRSHAPASADG